MEDWYANGVCNDNEPSLYAWFPLDTSQCWKISCDIASHQCCNRQMTINEYEADLIKTLKIL